MIKDILTYMTHSRYSLSHLFLSFISLLAIIGSITYITVGLTPVSTFIVFVVSLLFCLLLNHNYYKIDFKHLSSQEFSWSRYTILLTIAYCICFLAGIYFLYNNRSNLPLITPWQVVPPIMFLFYGIGTACLLVLTFRIKQWLATLLLGFHFLWSFSVVLIVFSIGYGYDPFIHQAAVQSIKQLGQIFPITFYYLGQYSLVSIGHSIFGGSIHFWDKILVPLLGSIILALSFLKLKQNNTLTYYGSALLLLIFSFSICIVTTPQNLAYIFLIATILWSIKLENPKELILIWLMALAAFITQPVAGIPAIIFTLSITSTFSTNILIKKIFTIITSIGYIFILPLAFYIFSQTNSGTIVQWQWPHLKDIFSFLILKNPIKEVWWLNSIYFLQSLQGIMYLLVVASGIIVAWKKKLWTYFKYFGLPMIGLLLSAIISTSFNFHFLIDYERSDYAGRILFVAGLFSLPFILLTLDNFIKHLQQKTVYIQLTWLILISILITTSFYFSYPRFDHYYNSHGFATSGADIEAVHWINNDALNQDYIVLANQQVSAAALREFGFSKYYKDLFYYPIPTGGPLYQYYLQMVGKPELATIEAAMKLTGVTKAYFVLNDYWWAADKLGPEAAAIADESITLGNGQIMIFEYNLK